MITPYGSGGGMSYWLLLVGLPLLVGLWAQFRVSSAFREVGRGARDLKYYRRGGGPRDSPGGADP